MGQKDECKDKGNCLFWPRWQDTPTHQHTNKHTARHTVETFNTCLIVPTSVCSELHHDRHGHSPLMIKMHFFFAFLSCPFLAVFIAVSSFRHSVIWSFSHLVIASPIYYQALQFIPFQQFYLTLSDENTCSILFRAYSLHHNSTGFHIPDKTFSHLVTFSSHSFSRAFKHFGFS